MSGMLVGVVGGLVRMFQGFVDAVPTLLVGLLVAAVMRYYLGPEGTRQLFGGQSLRRLPQSWLVGMLLPVCSVGVLPILFEMRRVGIKPGAMTAFALSAPLFNPLSLLYGLTLSRPAVIVMFALASLVVVTILGSLLDFWLRRELAGNALSVVDADLDKTPLIGVGRLFAVINYFTRQVTGRSLVWSIAALAGLFLLAAVLPFGSMQESVERDDPWAPATMTVVAIPVYATPMLTMSQLGMMFQHANSPGAAFVLLVLGTGLNLATIGWFSVLIGRRLVTAWFCTLLLTVVSLAYAINRPLIAPGVEPAGHTHAFDVYVNPFTDWEAAMKTGWVAATSQYFDLRVTLSLACFALPVLLGLVLRFKGVTETGLQRRYGVTFDADSKTATSAAGAGLTRYDRVVSPRLVGGVIIVGLIAFSVVLCYAYYPDAAECLEEIAGYRTQCLSGVTSKDYDAALYWLPVWEDWSRRTEVGAFLRHGQVRPYQRMQGYLLRKKLEDLEHALERELPDHQQILRIKQDLEATSRRWANAFRE